MSTPMAVEIQGLTKSFGHAQALRGLDLQVPTGQVTVTSAAPLDAAAVKAAVEEAGYQLA